MSWLVLDSFLTFTEDKEEWTGTPVVFDIREHDGRTRVTFIHDGLYPAHECYDVCSIAWGEYINGSVHTLIESGAGRPNSFEGEDVLEKLQAQHARSC